MPEPYTGWFAWTAGPPFGMYALPQMASPRAPAPGFPSSRRSCAEAGWEQDVPESQCLYWEMLLHAQINPQWVHFEWLTVRALFESVNDKITKFLAADIIARRRARWVTAQQAAGVERRPPDAANHFAPDFVVDYSNGCRTSFLLLGDPGEADASQYAVVEPLLRMHARAVGEQHTDFMVIVSDVIYPAGDVNEYVNAFYVPYAGYDKPIFALPGNHDWYDGLNGLMFHFCHSDPLEEVVYRWNSYNLKELLARQLWRRANRPNRAILGRYRDQRPPCQDHRAVPVQPGPYFAIDAGPVLLVAIDTGVDGSLDADQARWLLRISKQPKPKVLLTGKPIYVDGAYVPGAIKWHPRDPSHDMTVDDIVRDPSHWYVAVVGGDIHNYQRYPVRISRNGKERLIQYVVSGGGGAYLKATHTIPAVGYPERREQSSAGSRPHPEGEHPAGPWDAKSGFTWKDDTICPPDENEFRCYPLRGDSLTYFTRSFGPWLVVIVAGVMFTTAGALWALVLASPSTAHLLAGALAPLGLVAAIALVAFVSWLGNRRQLEAKSSMPPPHYGAAVAWFGAAAVLLACLGALLLLDDDTPYVALVAIGAPFVLIAIPILAYETRNVRPPGTAEVGLALPLAAMPLILVMRTDAPATTELLFAAGAALTVAVLTVAFGWIRTGLPKATGPTARPDEVATWIVFCFTVALFVLWSGVATAILVDEPTWVFGVILAVAVAASLIALSIRLLRHVGLNVAASIALVSVVIAANWTRLWLAIGGASLLLVFPVAVVVKALWRKPEGEAWRNRANLTPRQILVLVVTPLAIVVGAAGGFPLDGGTGRGVAYLLLAAALTALLIESPLPGAPPVKPPLRKSASLDPWPARTAVAKIAVVLAWYAVVVALLAVPGDGWAVKASVTSLSTLLIILAPVALYFIAPGEIWKASNDLLGAKELLPDEAADYVAGRLNQHTEPVQIRPVRQVTNTVEGNRDRRRLAATIYLSNPYRHSFLRDAWRTLVSEISDTDRPPFFKSFLRVDADQRLLRFRCFGVTGYERDDPKGSRLPTLEDEFTIDLSKNPVPTDA